LAIITFSKGNIFGLVIPINEKEELDEHDEPIEDNLLELDKLDTLDELEVECVRVLPDSKDRAEHPILNNSLYFIRIQIQSQVPLHPQNP
jgi:hypothetical protein